MTWRKAVPRWTRAAAAIVALALAGGAAWWFLQPAPINSKPSVAVLPFNNYGGDEGTGRLADGPTEDIIADLARFPEFEVAPFAPARRRCQNSPSRYGCRNV